MLIVSDKVNTRNRKTRLTEVNPKDKSDKSEETVLSSRQEDRENKGPPSGRPGIRTPRTVLEEANNSPSSVPKLRRRGGSVKSTSESLPQSRPRKKSKSKESEPKKDFESEAEEKEELDPLSKRLDEEARAKSEEEKPKKEEAPPDVEENDQCLKKEVAKPDEDEESESRERDREPEPPPPAPGADKVPPADDACSVKVSEDKPSQQLQKEEQEQKQEEEEQDQKAGIAEEFGATSGVLEKLSPLGRPGRHGLLPEDQERNRNNESPVILVERLNKPAQLHQLSRYPGLHHQHQLVDVPSNQRGGDEAGLMEMDAGPGGVASAGVLGIAAAGALRAGTYGDSGSDSGISSLRSAGSGDERSGSRSSALSAEETAPASSAPARVWHVQSVQHSSLLMAHPQGPTNSGASQAPVGYQPPAPGHHHAVPSEMLWRSPRYPPLPHGLLGPAQPSPEEMLERDRHERMIR